MIAWRRYETPALRLISEYNPPFKRQVRQLPQGLGMMGAERYVINLNIEVSVHANSGELWVFKTIPRMIVEGSG